jgi:hypothetical protein
MLNKKDWKEIIYKNGKIDSVQVFKELADYAFLMEQASKVYCHFTGLSKTNYFAKTIITLIEDKTYDRDITRDDIRDMLKNSLTKKDLISEIKEYFEI